MKEYDFIFSLGANCSVTMSLRDAGLQFSSLPLDWIGSPGLVRSCEMVECDFVNWFEREDLKLWDVRHEEGAVQRVYKNMRTGFGFPHEFTNANPIERIYDKTREKYERRIARFRELLSSSRRALGIYLEYATCLSQSNKTLSDVRKRLCAKYPNLELDLMYIHEVPGCREPKVESEKDGVIVVAADYGKFLNGVPMHTVDRSRLVPFFQEHLTVAGHDIAAEKAQYDAEQKRLRRNYWGNGACERWINRKLFRVYRRLQDYLIGQCLLPGDRPCWFEKEFAVWHHGTMPTNCPVK